MSTKRQPKAQSKAPNPNALEIVRDTSKTAARQFADISLSPVTMNALTARVWAEKVTGDIGLNESLAVVSERADAVKDGDLGDAKAMLMAQATALDAIFNEMARKASTLIRVKDDGTWSFPGETMDAVMRTAFKAQNQCRATLQTLGDLVNPRSVAFIKQTNNASGPQQINNGHAPAEKTVLSENKLLEDKPSERMDRGPQEAAGGADQVMAAVGEVHGTAVTSRKGRGSAKRKDARPHDEGGSPGHARTSAAHASHGQRA
jgi:hypothetical protein